MSRVTELAQELVLATDVSARDLAAKLKKPYSTLMREVNPYDTGAKLGADTLLEMMAETGKTAPLEYMAARLGFKLVRID